MWTETDISHLCYLTSAVYPPRLMAGRLELPQLERLLTPPSDILGHYLENDKGIKEREDAAIRCAGVGT